MNRKQLLRDFLQRVRSEGDAGAAARYLTPRYTIHHDPGDQHYGIEWRCDTADGIDYQSGGGSDDYGNVHGYGLGYGQRGSGGGAVPAGRGGAGGGSDRSGPYVQL